MPCLTMKKFSRPLHHPFDVGGIVLRPVAGALPADRAVIDAHLVAHLAAEQLVDRHAGRLAGDVPQRVLDGADRGAIGLERAALADLQHAALDVGRVLADQRVAEMQHPGLEVGLGVFHLAEAVEALVGDDADDRMLADDGAAQVGDFHDDLLFHRREGGRRQTIGWMILATIGPSHSELVAYLEPLWIGGESRPFRLALSSDSQARK